MDLKKCLKTIAFFFIIVASFSPIKTVKAQKSEEDVIVLFVEEGCPYCSKVKSFIKENELNEIDILYLREDPENAEFYNNVCEEAGISIYDRGVPMFYDNGEVIISADKIIEYIGQKYGVEVPEDPLGEHSNDSAGSNRIVFIILGFGFIASLLFLILNREN